MITLQGNPCKVTPLARLTRCAILTFHYLLQLMPRLETAQSQSLRLVVAVPWCHIVALDDIQCQPQPWPQLPDQGETLNLSPRSELGGPGNHQIPGGTTRNLITKINTCSYTWAKSMHVFLSWFLQFSGSVQLVLNTFKLNETLNKMCYNKHLHSVYHDDIFSSRQRIQHNMVSI